MPKVPEYIGRVTYEITYVKNSFIKMNHYTFTQWLDSKFNSNKEGLVELTKLMQDYKNEWIYTFLTDVAKKYETISFGDCKFKVSLILAVHTKEEQHGLC